MKIKQLKKYLYKEEKAEFQGWNFSYLKGRWEEEKLPWSYIKVIEKHLDDRKIILDLDTGDGSFLLKLNHPYEKTYVTENYSPNYHLCKKKLEPLGIEVKNYNEDNILLYDNNFFDLVLCRQGNFNVKEVFRVLKEDGVFITQQVGDENNNVLSKRLIEDFEPKFKGHNLKRNIINLEKNGFRIIYSNEYFPELKFFDIGAVVYFAKIIKWEFPGFTVDKCFDKLYEMQKELQEKGYIASLEHRFIITAERKSGI